MTGPNEVILSKIKLDLECGGLIWKTVIWGPSQQLGVENLGVTHTEFEFKPERSVSHTEFEFKLKRSVFFPTLCALLFRRPHRDYQWLHILGKLVSWCFEPSQPQRITSGLYTWKTDTYVTHNSNSTDTYVTHNINSDFDSISLSPPPPNTGPFGGIETRQANNDKRVLCPFDTGPLDGRCTRQQNLINTLAITQAGTSTASYSPTLCVSTPGGEMIHQQLF